MSARSSFALRSAALAGALAFLPVVSIAAPVPPGGGVNIDFVENFQLPSGEQLAQKVIDFTLQYNVPPGGTAAPTPSTTGTLTSSVYRGDAGGLVFVYDVDVVGRDTYVDETSNFSVGSFAGFDTDITGRLKDFDYFTAVRSTDGSTIRTETGEGIGAAPVIIVETNATTFDENGTARYVAGAEFLVTEPEDPDDVFQRTLDAFVDLTGVYQPVADDPGPGPTPNPIPLPPAAWAALMTMGAFGAGSRVRRFFRRSR